MNSGQRLRINLAYDGTDFHGWAAQPGLRTVQGLLESALATVLRVPAVSVTCAGRTDAGVHARGQVAHCDLASLNVSPEVLLRRLNSILPTDVRVHGISPAPDGFDARFSVIRRSYAYRIVDTAVATDPLVRGHVLSWPRPLDEAAMSSASALLVGEHDFAAFCKQREGATTVRTLQELSWHRDAGVLTGTVRADAFCHHMVRSLVGALIAVGEDRQPVSWVGALLAGRERSPAATVSPAHGLTLERVDYPPDDELAAQAVAARRRRNLG